MPIVDVQKLSMMMNITPRHVQRLASKSGMPRAARGQYDAGRCLLWYIRYLQRALEAEPVETGIGPHSSFRGERARSIRADAELKEIRLGEKRAALVGIGLVKQVFIDLVQMTKARVMATPPRIAPEVIGETSRVMIQAIVEKHLKEALIHLADDGSQYTLRPVLR
jgi:hypothetical protein